MSGAKLRTGWLLAAVGVLAAGAGCGRGEAYRPHVVVVLIDALRADRLGVAGYPKPTTPAIDRLAAEGVHFTTAIAHSTWTKPSIATLFTSLYPSWHGLVRVGVEREEGLMTDVLAEERVTLAERFQSAGWATAGIVNQVHLQHQFGFAQGFDHYRSSRGVTAPELNSRFEQWLDQRPPGPLFAYLHYLDVHWPYTRTLPGPADRFGPVEMVRRPPKRGDLVAEWARELERPSPDLAALEARYDREVAYADRAVAGVVALLRQRGLYEDVVLVVTSDHGEGFLEHGALQHGYAPYEELIRVPLVLRLPERLRGRTGPVATPAGLIDLLPTLLELAGLEPEPAAQGRSLAPLLRGEPLPERTLFAESVEAVAAHGGRHKLLELIAGERLFFDLETDPLEQRPGPCDGPCARLARHLEAFRRAAAEALAGQEGGTVPVTPADAELLKALGYL